MINTLLAVVCLAAAAGGPDPVAPPAHKFTLDNGLRVVLRENHTVPLVNVQLWIRAGSITETLARIALELTGDPEEVRKAVEYIKGLGIVVEPIQEK